MTHTPEAFNIRGFLKRCYLIYTIVIFFNLFLLLVPFFSIALLFNAQKMAVAINRYWGRLFYVLIGVKTVVENAELLDKKGVYIFCPNHFSFLDISLMPMVPVPFKFVGKVSISAVPVFGFFYKKFHITVDRNKLKDRYATYKKSLDALKSGHSLTIFPEGGIHVVHDVAMSRFKEGPFRMAIETGVQLVPVTLADNWDILPDDGKYLMKWKPRSRMIIHQPIDPSKYSLNNLKEFQNDVRQVIQDELNRLNAIV